MTETSLDELGPVDYVVVEFPAGASSFTGEMATELVALVDSGTIRLIDALVLTKAEDGSVDAMELSDIEELGELQKLEAELAELLAEDDILHLAAAMEPGSTAGVLIWENLWAARFASAARRSGGWSPRPSHPAQRQSPKPRSWPRPSHPDGRVAGAESSPGPGVAQTLTSAPAQRDGNSGAGQRRRASRQPVLTDALARSTTARVGLTLTSSWPRPEPGAGHASSAQRNPMLPVEESGGSPCRAETR